VFGFESNSVMVCPRLAGQILCLSRRGVTSLDKFIQYTVNTTGKKQ